MSKHSVPCPACGGTGKLEDQRYVGQLMRKMRETQGKTLRQVAAAMHLSAPYISDLELGRRHWTQGLKDRFNQALSK